MFTLLIRKGVKRLDYFSFFRTTNDAELSVQKTKILTSVMHLEEI